MGFTRTTYKKRHIAAGGDGWPERYRQKCADDREAVRMAQEAADAAAKKALADKIALGAESIEEPEDKVLKIGSPNEGVTQ